MVGFIALPTQQPSRRSALKAFTPLSATTSGYAQRPATATNPVVAENEKEGARDWQLTRVRLDKGGGFRAAAVEGYVSHQSVAAGERMTLHVSTNPVAEFVVEIFRTGYYGGPGAAHGHPRSFPRASPAGAGTGARRP